MLVEKRQISYQCAIYIYPSSNGITTNSFTAEGIDRNIESKEWGPWIYQKKKKKNDTLLTNVSSITVLCWIASWGTVKVEIIGGLKQKKNVAEHVFVSDGTEQSSSIIAPMCQVSWS